MQNHGFTLAAARSNFSLYGVKYAPGQDRRITGGDSPEEQAAKARVCAAFDAMWTTRRDEHDALWQTVVNAERELHRLLKIALRDYEQTHRR